MTDIFSLEGYPIIRLDVSSPKLRRSVFGYFVRAARYLSAQCRYLSSRRDYHSASLYIALSSGHGLVFELVIAMLARYIFGDQLILHYHNYSLVREKSLVIEVLVAISGPRALHIFLCGDMSNRFISLYPRVRGGCRVVSNAGLMDQEPADSEKSDGQSGVIRIGFFSNISREKGVYDFLQIIEEVRRSLTSENIEAILAGAFMTDAEEELGIRQACLEKGIKVRGALYGLAKTSFLNSLDVLVFPSSYKHEAQPLVIFEALSLGVEVISYDIGCTGELRDQPGFQLISCDNAAKALMTLISRPNRRPSRRSIATAARRESSLRKIDIAGVVDSVRNFAASARGVS